MAVYTLKLATGAVLTDDATPLPNVAINDPTTTTSITLTSTNGRTIRNTQTVGTTHEALVVGDMASTGYIRLRNKDATNFVQVGIEVAATFYPVLRCNAGKTTPWIPLTTNLTLYAKADTANVELDYWLLEA